MLMMMMIRTRYHLPSSPAVSDQVGTSLARVATSVCSFVLLIDDVVLTRHIRQRVGEGGRGNSAGKINGDSGLVLAGINRSDLKNDLIGDNVGSVVDTASDVLRVEPSKIAQHGVGQVSGVVRERIEVVEVVDVVDVVEVVEDVEVVEVGVVHNIILTSHATKYSASEASGTSLARQESKWRTATGAREESTVDSAAILNSQSHNIIASHDDLIAPRDAAIGHQRRQLAEGVLELSSNDRGIVAVVLDIALDEESVTDLSEARGKLRSLKVHDADHLLRSCNAATSGLGSESAEDRETVRAASLDSLVREGERSAERSHSRVASDREITNVLVASEGSRRRSNNLGSTLAERADRRARVSFNKVELEIAIERGVRRSAVYAHKVVLTLLCTERDSTSLRVSVGDSKACWVDTIASDANRIVARTAVNSDLSRKIGNAGVDADRPSSADEAIPY